MARFSLQLFVKHPETFQEDVMGTWPCCKAQHICRASCKRISIWKWSQILFWRPFQVGQARSSLVPHGILLTSIYLSSSHMKYSRHNCEKFTPHLFMQLRTAAVWTLSVFQFWTDTQIFSKAYQWWNFALSLSHFPGLGIFFDVLSSFSLVSHCAKRSHISWSSYVKQQY